MIESHASGEESSRPGENFAGEPGFKNNPPKVSVIYVNWNSAEDIARSVDSLHSQKPECSYEIIVLDNKSPEEPIPLLREDIRLIRNPENRGFGAGCNAAARHARGEYLLFLNPDTVLQNDVPGILSRFLDEHPEAGACGARMLNADGTVYYGAGRRCLGFINNLLEQSALCFHFPKVPFIGRPYYGSWDHLSTRKVECLSGACMMFRKDIYKALKGFDEDFFLYCEEMDLCKRALDAGQDIYYVHTAVIMHACRKSTMQYYGDMTNIFLQIFVSMDIYFKKHYGTLCAFVSRLLTGCIYLIKYCLHRRKADALFAKWGFFLVQYNRPNL